MSHKESEAEISLPHRPQAMGLIDDFACTYFNLKSYSTLPEHQKSLHFQIVFKPLNLRKNITKISCPSEPLSRLSVSMRGREV